MGCGRYDVSSSVQDGVLDLCPSHTAAARKALSEDVPTIDADRICIFSVDMCSVSAGVISDAADQVSDTYVPHICDDRVPGWVDKDVVAIIASYSGDCPEMLSVFDDLSDRGCTVVCVTSGGELMRRSRDAGVTVIEMPEGLDDRDVVWYSLGTLAMIVQRAGMFPAADLVAAGLDHIDGSIDLLKAEASALAYSIEDKVVAVYSTSDSLSCSRYWKYTVGEATGDPAFCGELPEFDHNELVGWSDPNSHAPELQMVVLKGSTYGHLVSSIVHCMEEVLIENGRPVTVIDIGSGDSMCRNMVGMVLADMVLEFGRCNE